MAADLLPSITLKPGRERSLLRRHPWIFSGAIAKAVDGLVPGSTVDVLSSRGEYLARAAFSPHSQICGRIWTFADEVVDAPFLGGRIRDALQTRSILGIKSSTDAYRLVYAESDRLPGLIVDRYADVLVAQFLSAGADFWRETIADLLLEETGLSCLYERSDADVRDLEGLPSRTGWMRGSAGSARIEIVENGLKYMVDLAGGHKTGFYLDQRDNRKRLRDLSQGREVLDCFCYSGGFSLSALAGSARLVLALDSSAEALALANANAALNHLAGPSLVFEQGDVFQMLRRLRDQGRSFDMVILDPPKFAPTASFAEKAARGYKDINLLAFKLLRPKGILVSFSCSGGVDAALFQKIVAGAALDAKAETQVLERLEQAPDHPIALEFPEAAYLKGLVILKVS